MANSTSMPGASLMRRVRSHLHDRRAERHLRSLEPHLLRDIGLNPDSMIDVDLHAEASRRLLGAR